MTKNEFLFELNKNLKVLDSVTRDDLIEYYEGIIDEEVSSGRSLFDVFNKLGNPKDLARKIINNINNGEESLNELDELIEPTKPVYKTTKSKLGSDVYKVENLNKNDESSKFYKKSGGFVEENPTKEPKKKLSKFWIIYFALGIITIPLTLGLGAMALGLACGILGILLAVLVIALILPLCGVIIFGYAIALAVMGKSIMLMCVFGGIGLLVFALGLYTFHLTLKLFKWVFIRRKKGGKA